MSPTEREVPPERELPTAREVPPERELPTAREAPPERELPTAREAPPVHGSMREREPSRDELLAMAYSDGELSPAERAAFEARLAREPLLAKELAELRELAVLARHAAPPEPEDHEWERIRCSPMQRTLGPFAWTLVVLATAGLAGWLLWTECTCGLELLPKLCVIALTVGLFVLLGLTVRNRMRTLPYDPYTKVKR